MGVMLVPAAQKHLLNKAVDQGSLQEMLMPEYLAAHWEHSSGLQRHPRYQCKKHSNSPIPAFSEGVRGEKDF